MVWRLNRLGRSLPDLVQIVAELERSLIRERTHAGLAAARARDRSGGHKPKLEKKQVREVKVLLCDPEIQVADVVLSYGVSRTTLYKDLSVVTHSTHDVHRAHSKTILI